MHHVQLWGPLSRGRNSAFLREDALLGTLPAAVGLPVETPYGPGVCRACRFTSGSTSFGQIRRQPGVDAGTAADACSTGAGGSSAKRRDDDDHTGVSQIIVDLPWGKASLHPRSVWCPAAVTLPLISRFLDRAAALFSMHSNTLSRLREALNGLGLERLQARLSTQASEAMEAASRVWEELENQDAKSMVDTFMLKADEVLADPQMKEVFSSGVARLNKLICSAKGFDGVWVGKNDGQPRCTIDDSVITWHWGQDSELEIWSADQVSTALIDDTFRGRLREDGCLQWSDGDVWVRSGPLSNGTDTGSNSVGDLGEDKAELAFVQQTLEDMRRILNGGAGFEGEVEQALAALKGIASSDSEVQRIAGEMEQRREALLELRGQVMQSKTGQILSEGQERLRGQLAKLRETAITPQLERVQQRSRRFLTRLATDRKVKDKATELFSAARERIAAKWTDASDSGNLEAWVGSVKDRVVGQLGAQRALLVDSLGGLELQQVDLRQLITNSWDPVALEAQLQRSLVRAVKLSGLESGSGAELLERFEGASLVAKIPAVQRTYQGLLLTLADMNVEVPPPIHKLLEAQAAGRQLDAEAWREAVIGSLDDASVVRSAEILVNHGERLLTRCQELKENQTVARVMEHLESEDIERKLLRNLHSLDAQAMLSSAESALTNAEAREQLVSKLKDTCLDFILKILPAIHIDKVTGNNNGCDWEINNISFSDFSFRKENVHITLGNPANASEELLRVSAWDISAHFRDLKVFVKQTSLPYLQAECVADARAERMSVALAFRLVPSDSADAPVAIACSPVALGVEAESSSPSAASGAYANLSSPSRRASTGGAQPTSSPPQAAGERRASAPGGVSASGGGSTSSGGVPHGHPVLAMSSRSVLMDNLELWVGETNYAVIVNALSFLFADVLKNYACETIANHLDEHVGTLIGALNSVLSTCAPYLERLGFTLPAPSVSLAAAGQGGGIASGAGVMDGTSRDVMLEEGEALFAAAVPRLAGRGGGRLDGLPEEIDWADPGRAFAVRM